MAKDLLLEIGLEEVPARFVRGAMEQLKEKTIKWLSDARIGYGRAEAYATPRRIAVLIRDVEEKQADSSEEAKGPSRKIALDADGNWSKAALGFARSQGVDPEELYFKELAGVEYVYANKSSVGVETAGLLPDGLSSLIVSMSFPKNMRWGSHELRFIRPIRWMVALFGQDVIPFELAGVSTDRTTRGHRFLGSDHGTAIEEAGQYLDKLRAEHVIADTEERQALIVSGIEELMKEKGWTIAVKEDLLEEVLFLVEYPNVLYGAFEESFLQIPQEVLITSMREHQRYFPVLDQEGRLLPFFVTVRNGDRRSIELVAKGNEKVLRARLSDAKFFYEEDHKLTIGQALSKLETIVYHEELGTVADKVRRIKAAAQAIAGRLPIGDGEAKQISRAAEICKFDLVSQMVYEFPELQGIMGEDYARRLGEPEPVAKAVNEHYQPRFSGDRVPSELTGAVVSLADKIDTIVGCFSIGIVPTGSQDPYALRRQAAGIVSIMLAYDLGFGLEELFDMALEVHEQRGMKRPAEQVRKDLHDFFGLRVKNWLSEQHIRYDVVEAVMAAGISDLTLVSRRAAAVQAHAAGESKAEFKLTVEAFNRVGNLAAKSAGGAADPSLFSEEAEKELYEAWQQRRAAALEAMNGKDVESALRILSELRPAINGYFEHVMVMAQDEKIRDNRLALLAGIASDISLIADFSKLVW